MIQGVFYKTWRKLSGAWILCMHTLNIEIIFCYSRSSKIYIQSPLHKIGLLAVKER
jgi:hypothetical protein